jgi:hypothetical protein
MDVWVEVRAAAKLNRRSVNQEIVWRLSERGVIPTDRPEASALVGERLGASAPRSESSPGFKPDFGSRLKGGGDAA